MDYGVWCMVYGFWFMVYRFWFMDHEFWLEVTSRAAGLPQSITGLPHLHETAPPLDTTVGLCLGP